MRRLTFAGFLKGYVNSLSYSGTNSIYKLAREAEESNYRLRAPLFFYALETGKSERLMQAVKNEGLRAEYEAALSGEYTDEYLKVLNSYDSEANMHERDAELKSLMREKILNAQEKRSITNYRIYTDLHLNPGNLNSWLKHGDGNKVSLSTARAVLNYIS